MFCFGLGQTTRNAICFTLHLLNHPNADAPPTGFTLLCFAAWGAAFSFDPDLLPALFSREAERLRLPEDSPESLPAPLAAELPGPLRFLVSSKNLVCPVTVGEDVDGRLFDDRDVCRPGLRTLMP